MQMCHLWAHKECVPQQQRHDPSQVLDQMTSHTWMRTEGFKGGASVLQPFITNSKILKSAATLEAHDKKSAQLGCAVKEKFTEIVL